MALDYLEKFPEIHQTFFLDVNLINIILVGTT
jgi:hypothetical protein